MRSSNPLNATQEKIHNGKSQIDNLCLIPAKAASKRLPRKNLLPLGNGTLLSRCIEKAKASSFFSRVCVSTEADEVAAEARKCGAEVPFIRPKELAVDPSTISDVIRHAIDHYRTEGLTISTVSVMLPTTPFLQSHHIDESIELFKRSKSVAVMSVSACEFPPFNALVIERTNDVCRLRSCFPDSEFRNTKSTECPSTYRSNGGITILDVSAFDNVQNLHELPITPYIVEQQFSLDIDTEWEYRMALALDAALVWDST